MLRHNTNEGNKSRNGIIHCLCYHNVNCYYGIGIETKRKLKTLNTMKLTNEQINDLKEIHEKIRQILIDHSFEEYGDNIIDQICEAVGIESTIVYYEE